MFILFCALFGVYCFSVTEPTISEDSEILFINSIEKAFEEHPGKRRLRKKFDPVLKQTLANIEDHVSYKEFLKQCKDLTSSINDSHFYVNLQPINNPNQRNKILYKKIGKFPVVAIKTFNATEEIKQFCSKHDLSNEKVVVIDLRDNAGGLYSNVYKVLKMIYGSNPFKEYNIVEELEGEEVHRYFCAPEFKSKHYRPNKNQTFFILLNSKTASAALRLVEMLWMVAGRCNNGVDKKIVFIGENKNQILKSEQYTCVHQKVVEDKGRQYLMTISYPTTIMKDMKRFNTHEQMPRNRKKLVRLIEEYVKQIENNDFNSQNSLESIRDEDL